MLDVLAPMLERILQVFNPEQNPRPAIPVDAQLLSLLEQLAAEEQRPVADVVAELLWHAVTDRLAAVENFQPWEELTPREKQTAALACLGYTNHEIAESMVISTNTVKTHIRHVLRKFRVSSKSELGQALAGWDFAAWLEAQELWPNGSHPAKPPSSPPGITP